MEGGCMTCHDMNNLTWKASSLAIICMSMYRNIVTLEQGETVMSKSIFFLNIYIVKPCLKTLNFQTEAKQLLQLMIHSLYSNREIFLRELISNASDAIDKLRFQAIEQPDLYGDDSELHIDVTFDKDAKTLCIADNGIGMAREELADTLGTIAKSGTEAFLAQANGDEKDEVSIPHNRTYY